MDYVLARHGRHWKHKQLGQSIPIRAAPSEVNPGEMDEVQQWIRTNDPDLNEIKARAGGR